MNGYKQVSTRLAGYLVASSQRNIVVAVPGQNTLHAGLCIYGFFKFACNTQNNIFFTSLFLTNGTRIFAAMTGIDSNDHAAVGFIDISDMFDQGGFLSARFCEQVNHQAVAVLCCRIQQETF